MRTARRHDFYTGRSGQLAVIAEFLRRGYNAAIPEIDVGDDIFVIEDATGKLSRVQVKSAIGKGKHRVYAIFNLSLKQLERARVPELWYVFAVYHHELWREFVVVRRDVLQSLHARSGFGRIEKQAGRLTFYVSFSDDDVRCGGMSLQTYRGNWNHWPFIQH
jgi:hypothetical protein